MRAVSKPRNSIPEHYSTLHSVLNTVCSDLFGSRDVPRIGLPGLRVIEPRAVRIDMKRTVAEGARLFSARLRDAPMIHMISCVILPVKYVLPCSSRDGLGTIRDSAVPLVQIRGHHCVDTFRFAEPSSELLRWSLTVKRSNTLLSGVVGCPMFAAHRQRRAPIDNGKSGRPYGWPD